MSPIKFLDFTVISFAYGRKVQSQLITLRKAGRISDTLLFCEHYPVLTMGKRLENSEAENDKFWRERGVFCVKTNRGGEITYHGPGQLVIYPVVSLTERGLGVRKFVELGMEILAEVVASYGLINEIKLNPMGLFAGKESERLKKVAAVGLKIEKGVTNHGFSLNVNLDLEPYNWFSPCGGSGQDVGSLESLIGEKVLVSEVRERVKSSFVRHFS